MKYTDPLWVEMYYSDDDWCHGISLNPDWPAENQVQTELRLRTVAKDSSVIPLLIRTLGDGTRFSEIQIPRLLARFGKTARDALWAELTKELSSRNRFGIVSALIDAFPSEAANAEAHKLAADITAGMGSAQTCGQQRLFELGQLGKRVSLPEAIKPITRIIRQVLAYLNGYLGSDHIRVDPFFYETDIMIKLGLFALRRCGSKTSIAPAFPLLERMLVAPPFSNSAHADIIIKIFCLRADSGFGLDRFNSTFRRRINRLRMSPDEYVRKEELWRCAADYLDFIIFFSHSPAIGEIAEFNIRALRRSIAFSLSILDPATVLQSHDDSDDERRTEMKTFYAEQCDAAHQAYRSFVKEKLRRGLKSSPQTVHVLASKRLSRSHLRPVH